MLNRLFGNYLVEKKCITQEQLEHLLPVPQELIADIETIAVVRKILTPTQVQAVLDKIDRSTTRFGDAALEEGLISDDRLDHLISFQTNAFMKFMQLLVNENFIRMDQLNQIISSFQTDNEYTDSQMNSLMLDDLEEIIKIFVPLKNKQLQRFRSITNKESHHLILSQQFVHRSSSKLSYLIHKAFQMSINH